MPRNMGRQKSLVNLTCTVSMGLWCFQRQLRRVDLAVNAFRELLLLDGVALALGEVVGQFLNAIQAAGQFVDGRLVSHGPDFTTSNDALSLATNG
jgi:hypothetical protein